MVAWLGFRWNMSGMGNNLMTWKKKGKILFNGRRCNYLKLVSGILLTFRQVLYNTSWKGKWRVLHKTRAKRCFVVVLACGIRRNNELRLRAQETLWLKSRSEIRKRNTYWSTWSFMARPLRQYGPFPCKKQGSKFSLEKSHYRSGKLIPNAVAVYIPGRQIIVRDARRENFALFINDVVSDSSGA